MDWTVFAQQLAVSGVTAGILLPVIAWLCGKLVTHQLDKASASFQQQLDLLTARASKKFSALHDRRVDVVFKYGQAAAQASSEVFLRLGPLAPVPTQDSERAEVWNAVNEAFAKLRLARMEAELVLPDDLVTHAQVAERCVWNMMGSGQEALFADDEPRELREARRSIQIVYEQEFTPALEQFYKRSRILISSELDDQEENKQP